MTQAEISALALNLMSEHRLYSWAFRFDNHRRRFGACNYREQFLTISWPVCQLNSDADIIDTIKHEIAHALTPGALHGRIWKLQAMIVGARPETCAASHVKQVPGRWQFHCPCGIDYNRYRQPSTKPGARYRCPDCRALVIWTDTQAPTLTPTVGELYAAITQG